MVKKKEEPEIKCPACGAAYLTGNLDRVCSNCFACTGCEIYCCPACNSEITVKPVKDKLIVKTRLS